MPDTVKSQIVELSATPVSKDEKPIPLDYVMLVLEIEINQMVLTVDNEFDQRIMVVKMAKLDFKTEVSGQQLSLNLNLDDFNIEDLWSENKNQEF